MADNDILKLEKFLRAYIDIAKKMGVEYANVFWNKAVNNFVKKTEHDFYYDLNSYSKSVRDVVDIIKSDKANKSEILDVVSFITREVYVSENYQRTSYLKMFLNRIKDFKDTDLVYDALVELKGMVGYCRPKSMTDWHIKEKQDVFENIVNMLASNPNATQHDINELIYWAKTPEQALKIINDVFAKTDDVLDAEMKKDVPNTSTVQEILWFPENVIRVASGNAGASEELCSISKRYDRAVVEDYKKSLQNFRQIANSKYDFDTVIGSGDMNYVSNYDDTVAARNVELEKSNEELSGENERLMQSNNSLRENADKNKSEIERLKQQLQQERDARIATENLLKTAEKVIEVIKQGEKTVDKAGIFNKATKRVEVKQKIQEVEEELARAKSAEAQRKAVLAKVQMKNNQPVSI